ARPRRRHRDRRHLRIRQHIPDRRRSAEPARRLRCGGPRQPAQVTKSQSVHSHLLLLVLFALLVSIVFAVLMRDELKTQLQFGVVLVGSFVVGAIVLGWLMYPVPL